MHENDRSATGFLMPDEFQAAANQFFAQPQISVRGWERAADAQLRIVREVEHVLARNGPGECSLSATVALELCCIAIIRVSRSIALLTNLLAAVTFSRSKDDRRAQHSWCRLEDL